MQIFLYRTDLFHDAKLCRAYYERFHENLVVPTTSRAVSPRCGVLQPAAAIPDSPTEYGTTMTCGSASVAASDFLPFYLSRIDRFGSTPETLRLDCPEMQAAMRQYHALEKFSCKQNWWGDSIQKFAEGKTAMTVIYSNYAAELINSGNSVVVGRVGAAILPGCQASAGRRHCGHLPIQPKSGSLQAVLPLVLLCGCGFPAGSSGWHLPHCGCL